MNSKCQQRRGISWFQAIGPSIPPYLTDPIRTNGFPKSRAVPLNDCSATFLDVSLWIPLPLKHRPSRTSVVVPRAFFNFGKKEEPKATAPQPPKPAPAVQRPPENREPPYITVKQINDKAQIRFYKPFPVVETEYVQRSDGFDRLGDYLDGGNVQEMKMWTSQPCFMFISPDKPKIMQLFVLPRTDIAIENLPAPVNPLGTCVREERVVACIRYLLKGPRPPPLTVLKHQLFTVRLNMSGGEVLAALKFEGNATPEVVEQKKQELIQLLAAEKLTPLDVTETRLAQYGAVFSLNRENEVHIRIKL